MVYGPREWVLKGRVRDDIFPDLEFTPVFKSLMELRGFSDSGELKTFLAPTLADLRDPRGMLGIEKAVERLASAIISREPIGVFSDYDVDGVCSAALLHRFLVRLGQEPPVIFIPDRNEDGYGLSIRGLEQLRDNGVSLLITADCGITAVDQVEYAKSLGMDVIVTDHHEPEGPLPAALSVVNPKQPECPFATEDLCGAGVVFHLIVALRSTLRERGFSDLPNLRQDLDLVALATVADVVRLSGINRILVKEGLNVLNSQGCLGTYALARVAGIRKEIMARDLGFILGPRINAAGRVANAYKAVDLLITQDASQADCIAQELHRLNRLRQIEEQKVLKEAISMIDGQGGVKNVVVVAGTGWNTGVIGIVASRLASRYTAPAIVISINDDGTGRASGRSLDGVDLHAAVSRLSHMLVRFGGHKKAVGFTIESDRILKFTNELEKVVAGMENDAAPQFEVDLRISALDLSPALLDELELLAPYGEGNPEPVFMMRSMEVVSRRKLGGNRLKLVLRQSDRLFHTQGFTLPIDPDTLPRFVDVAFTPLKTRLNGHVYLSLALKALCPV